MQLQVDEREYINGGPIRLRYAQAMVEIGLRWK